MSIPNFSIILLLVLATGCKLTEKSVTGKWISGSDTLFVEKDHSFLLTNRHYNYLAKDSVRVPVISIASSTGKWRLSRRTLYLDFNADKKEIFGNCDILWNWRKFFSRYKLIRPSVCYEPSNRFVVYKKINVR